MNCELFDLRVIISAYTVKTLLHSSHINITWTVNKLKKLENYFKMFSCFNTMGVIVVSTIYKTLKLRFRC